MRKFWLRVILVALVVVVGIGAATIHGGHRQPHALFRGQPRVFWALNSQLRGVSAVRVRIVKLAESQLGYRTNPRNSYCNKFSAFWYSGSSNCPAGELNEEWCADFAAWAWKKAGVPVVYQYINGDLNSSSASFYEWAVRTGTWHPVGSGYRPRPGDVAVYGLNTHALVAAHVAVVVATSGRHHAPDGVNGDADHRSFSDVELAMHEIHPDARRPGVTLSGYASPPPTSG